LPVKLALSAGFVKKVEVVEEARPETKPVVTPDVVVAE
jgi:hypothetical protein